MPLPIATHQQHGEVHGKAKIWAAQANRYRELARAREEHGQHYGDLLVAAIADSPPRGRDQTWTQRDQKIASGRATPEEIGAWALEAKALAEEENRRVTAARWKAWNDWVPTSWTKYPGKVYAWCKTERPAPILSTTDAQANWLLDPNGIAQEAAEQWGKLWKPPPPTPGAPGPPVRRSARDAPPHGCSPLGCGQAHPPGQSPRPGRLVPRRPEGPAQGGS